MVPSSRTSPLYSRCPASPPTHLRNPAHATSLPAPDPPAVFHVPPSDRRLAGPWARRQCRARIPKRWQTAAELKLHALGLPREADYDRRGVRHFSVPRLQVELLSEQQSWLGHGGGRARVGSQHTTRRRKHGMLFLCFASPRSEALRSPSLPRRPDPQRCACLACGGWRWRAPSHVRTATCGPTAASDSVRAAAALVMQGHSSAGLPSSGFASDELLLSGAAKFARPNVDTIRRVWLRAGYPARTHRVRSISRLKREHPWSGLISLGTRCFCVATRRARGDR